MTDLRHQLEELEHLVEEKVPFYLRRYWRWPAIGIAALVVPLALGLWTFRLVEPLVPQYRADAEAFASRALGWPVRIERMWLGWHWFGPEVVVEGVRVLAPDSPSEHVLIRADRIRVGIAPGDFLRGGAFRPARVLFESPRLGFEVTPDGKVLLAGEQVGDLTGPPLDWRPLLKQLLAHGRLEVSDGDFTWHDRRSSVGRVQVADVQFAVQSDGSDHELELELTLPEGLGRSLALELEAEGDAGAPETWTWTGRLDAEGVRVDWLQTRLRPEALYRPTGVVDLDTAVSATGLQFERLDGKVRARSLTVAPRGATPRFVPDGSGVDLLDARFTWARDGAAWQMGLTDLNVRRGTRAWQADGMRLEFAPTPDGTRFAGDAALIRVEDLALLASWLPREVFPYTADLLDIAPHGDLRELRFGLELAGGSLRDYEVVAGLSDVGFDRQGRIPGMRGLTGQLEARRAGGSFRLASRDLGLDFGRLFRTPLSVAQADAVLGWTIAPEGTTLRAEQLVLDDPRAHVEAELLYTLPASGEPWLRLTGSLRDGDLTAKSTFLPVAVMSPDLVAWLDRAVVEGRVTEANFLIDGPARHFPFRDGSGEFDVRFHAVDAILDYAPGWPRAEALTADVTFHNIGLWLSEASGTAAGVPFEGASASIEDLAVLDLRVRAASKAPAESLVAFVRQSPLAERFRTLFDEVTVRGPVRTAVELAVPLRDLAATRVRVRSAMGGAAASVRGLPFGARRLSGEIEFTERSARSGGLRGELLGAPLTLRVDTEDDGTTRLDLEARAGIVPLAKALELPLERVLAGQTPVQAVVRVPPHGSAQPLGVDLKSELRGLAVDLPAPLGKTEEALSATSAELRFPDRDQLQAVVRYGDHAVGRYHFLRRDKQWGLAGDDAAHIDVQAPEVVIEPWLRNLQAGEAAADTPRLALPFRTLALDAAHLLAWGQSLESVTLRMERFPDAWTVRVASPAAEGTLRVPDDLKAFPIEADLERLWLRPAAATAGTTETAATDPRDLPALSLRVGSLHFAGADLGAVDAVVERRPWGLTLTSLAAEGRGFTLTGGGRWEHEEGRSRTRIEAALRSTDVDDTLSALGFPAAVEAGRGALDVALDWPGGPLDDPLGRMNGTVKLEVGTGRLRDVQPGGASRALGLFSVAALPRRLTLDFRDVLAGGLSFDTVRGDFLIDQGNAYTTNLRLQGANLSMVLVGRTGLATRDYDQLATIDTSLGATLPVAGALAAGPAGAAAALVVSQLFRRTLADATRVHYRITGPWDAPVIERATAEEAKR